MPMPPAAALASILARLTPADRDDLHTWAAHNGVTAAGLMAAAIEATLATARGHDLTPVELWGPGPDREAWAAVIARGRAIDAERRRRSPA